MVRNSFDPNSQDHGCFFRTINSAINLSTKKEEISCRRKLKWLLY